MRVGWADEKLSFRNCCTPPDFVVPLPRWPRFLSPTCEGGVRGGGHQANFQSSATKSRSSRTPFLTDQDEPFISPGPRWGAFLSGIAAERMRCHLPPPTPPLPHQRGGRQKDRGLISYTRFNGIDLSGQWARSLGVLCHFLVMLPHIDLGRDLCFQGGTKQLREPRI